MGAFLLIQGKINHLTLCYSLIIYISCLHSIFLPLLFISYFPKILFRVILFFISFNMQSEYKRGVSAWIFDIEDLKIQASLVLTFTC